MATPTYEQLLEGCTSWRPKRVDTLSYVVKFHGFRESSYTSYFSEAHPGIWNYYVYIDERLFSKEDFAQMLMRKNDGYYEYFDFPDVYIHGGITYYDVVEKTDRSGNKYRVIEIGCDFNHLWDNESGYPDDLESVSNKAERTICDIVKLFPPVNGVSDYSYEVFPRDELVITNNGRKIHPSEKLGEASVSPYYGWKPALPPSTDPDSFVYGTHAQPDFFKEKIKAGIVTEKPWDEDFAMVRTCDLQVEILVDGKNIISTDTLDSTFKIEVGDTVSRTASGGLSFVKGSLK